jgi:hypothetical protein
MLVLVVMVGKTLYNGKVFSSSGFAFKDEEDLTVRWVSTRRLFGLE